MEAAQNMITKPKNFDVDEVGYKPPRLNKRGGKNISIVYDSHKFILQTPNMQTWGLNERVDEDTGRVSYDLNMQFTKRGEVPSNDKFLDVIKACENKVLDDSVVHSKEWFGKAKMSREVSENLMYPMLRYPKNKDTGDVDYDRPPTLRLKLSFWDDKFNLELYDKSKKMVFDPKENSASELMELVPSRSNLKGLIECGGLWFVGGRFGVTWRFIQGQVEAPVTIKGFCMLDSDSDSSDDAQEAVPQPKKKKVVRRKKKKESTED